MKVYRIQLPKVGNDGTDNAGHIEDILSSIALVTGGLTAQDAVGLWVDEQGRTIRDNVVDVTTYCTAEEAYTLGELVEFWRELLNQDALVIATWDAGVKFYDGGTVL